MRKFLLPLLLALSLFAGGLGHAAGPEAQPGLVSAPVSKGGSNYVCSGGIEAYHKTLALDEKTGKHKLDPSKIQSVVGAYHLNRDTVNRQIAEIARSGQKILSLPLWFLHAKPENLSEGYRGINLYSNGGKLQPTQAESLQAIVREVVRNKFSRFILRFGPQGRNNPYLWTATDEELTREDTEFIVSTVRAVRRQLAGSGVELLVDLGMEQAGVVRGQNEQYVKTLWTSFCSAAPDCIRFAYYSFNPIRPHIESRIANQSRWHREAKGGVPDFWAFDVYGYGGGLHLPVAKWMVYEHLLDIAKEMAGEGLSKKKMFLQEVFYNDMATAQDIRRFTQETQINLESIVQWPVSRKTYQQFVDKGVKAFSTVDYPVDFDAYLPLVGGQSARPQ